MFYEDFETKALIAIHDKALGTSMLDVDNMAKLKRHIQDRREMVRMGVMRCPSWFQEELNRLDSKMRAWWDAWEEKWVLDRLQEEGFYLTVIQFKPTPDFQLDRNLLDTLRANDLQRYSDPKEYVRKKREAAALKQKQNEAASDEKVLEAIDGMSSKQIKNFIEVTEAIRTGETITAHGSDLAFLERAQADKQKALESGMDIKDDPNACINPGMHPLTYERRTNRS